MAGRGGAGGGLSTLTGPVCPPGSKSELYAMEWGLREELRDCLVAAAPYGGPIGTGGTGGGGGHRGGATG